MRRRASLAAGVVLVIAACTSEPATQDNELPPPEFTSDIGSEVWSTTSPDGALRIDVGLDEGVPSYRVIRVVADDEIAVLGSSSLGLETSLGSFGRGLVLVDAGQPSEWSDEFSLPTGKQRSARIEGTTRTIRFDAPANPVDADLEVELVATDAGVAFRSRIVLGAAAPSEATLRLDWERTSFAVPPTSLSWLQKHDRGARFTPAYEKLRSGARSVTAPSSSTEGWTLPALFETNETWTLITEAGLGAGGAGSHLSGTTVNGEFVLALPSDFDGAGFGAVEPTGSLPFATPWRVIVNSADLGDIVETNLVRHLSAAGPELPWVEPGVVSWSWWSDQDSPRDPDALKRFIDLAAEQGWEYSLIDANWNDIADDDFADVVDYAASLDVGLLLWYNSGGPNNSVTEAPRGAMTDRGIRRSEMERIAELGIRGIKVDFFHSDKPVTIAQYLDILADAADFELLVDFHGSTVPRGWSRTWPNLMTMEAVAGNEQYIFNPGFPSLAAPQHTVLPFTRNVVGSMDYTPVSLGNRYPRQTSNAHELALAVIFESGLQHFVDTPENYAEQPIEVREFLRDVPVAWDETQYLSGRPDEGVALARRRGDEWWIGLINGTREPMTITFDPAAIDVVGWSAQRFCDGEGNRSFTIDDVTLDGPVNLQMLPSGGCSLRLTPK